MSAPNPRSRKYPPVTSGQWVQPVRRGYGLQCCDCGLVHRLNFRLVSQSSGRIVPDRRLGLKVQFQAFRDERATAQVRRHRG